MSRSVTIVCAYLMKKCRIRSNVALELVRQVRPQADPNDGFIQQLLTYEQLLQVGPYVCQ